MRKLLPLLLFSFIATGSEAAAPRPSLQPHSSLFPMIVGGSDAEAGEFPFMVSLQTASNRRHFCGGSLIRPDWVLTAAHCAEAYSASKVKVVIGLRNLSDKEGVEVHSVKEAIIHPDYEKEVDADYDFALLHLDSASSFAPIDTNTTEIDIPEIEDDSPMALTIGWGYTKEGGPISQSLRKVEVPYVSAKRCEDAYPKSVTDRMVCAGRSAGGKDACQGDSGGPLVSTDADGKLVLTGVVSWGEGCARPKKFGVYSKVNSVDSWIAQEAR